VSEPIVVYKCSACGDVFPLHEGDDRVCPSCGSVAIEVAHEPLL
jgi:DNA-directed RNA polymerase subunit RPC12/RpoP